MSSISSKKRTKTSWPEPQWGIICSSKVEFVCFLEEMLAWKKYFDFVWPLIRTILSLKNIFFLSFLIWLNAMSHNLHNMLQLKMRLTPANWLPLQVPFFWIDRNRYFNWFLNQAEKIFIVLWHSSKTQQIHKMTKKVTKNNNFFTQDHFKQIYLSSCKFS